MTDSIQKSRRHPPAHDAGEGTHRAIAQHDLPQDQGGRVSRASVVGTRAPWAGSKSTSNAGSRPRSSAAERIVVVSRWALRHRFPASSMTGRAFTPHCGAFPPTTATCGFGSAWRSRRPWARTASNCGTRGADRATGTTRRMHAPSGVRSAPTGASASATLFFEAAKHGYLPNRLEQTAPAREASASRPEPAPRGRGRHSP